MKKELLSLGLLLGSYGFSNAGNLVSDHPLVSGVLDSDNEITISVEESGIALLRCNRCTGSGGSRHCKSYSKYNINRY